VRPFGTRSSERLLAARPIEDIPLLHPDPGQLAALLAQLIAQLAEFLLLTQVLFARHEPFLSRHDAVVLYLALLQIELSSR
jgi:hypothetical protein